MHIRFHTLLENLHYGLAWNTELNGFCSCGGDFLFLFFKNA